MGLTLNNILMFMVVDEEREGRVGEGEFQSWEKDRYSVIPDSDVQLSIRDLNSALQVQYEARLLCALLFPDVIDHRKPLL